MTEAVLARCERGRAAAAARAGKAWEDVRTTMAPAPHETGPLLRALARPVWEPAMTEPPLRPASSHRLPPAAVRPLAESSVDFFETR